MPPSRAAALSSVRDRLARHTAAFAREAERPFHVRAPPTAADVDRLETDLKDGKEAMRPVAVPRNT